jgi:hypothetical protein
MAPKQRSAAKEILSALDADPALMEHYDPNEIEAIPLASIQTRLVELGLMPAIPVRLQRLISESMPSPAADILRVLADDVDCMQPQNVEARPLAEVTACLQRRGTNYRPGVAAIIDFVGELACDRADFDQTRVCSIKSAKMRGRKSLVLAPIGLAATTTAAVAAMVGFFVTQEAPQDKVIAEQRYEIQELGHQVQGLKARLKEMGVDDFISSMTRVPLSNPLEDRTWPPQSGDRNAWAAAGGAAPAGAPSLGIGTGRAMAFQAFQQGARALRAGDTKSGLEALEYAARNGEVMALWKLGRMYADGEGVKQSDQRAFEYFRTLADSHEEETPGRQESKAGGTLVVERGWQGAISGPGGAWRDALQRRIRTSRRGARPDVPHSRAKRGHSERDLDYGLVQRRLEGGDPRRASRGARSSGAVDRTVPQRTPGVASTLHT